jgi:hypothetical protein
LKEFETTIMDWRKQSESDINAILKAFNDYDFIKLKNELEKPKWYNRIFRTMATTKELKPTPNLPIKFEVNRQLSDDKKTIVAKQNIIGNKKYVITTLLNKIRNDLEQQSPEIQDKIKAISDILEKVENEKTIVSPDVQKFLSTNEKVEKEKIVSPDVEKLLSTTIENLNRLENYVGFIVSKLYQHYKTNNPDITLEEFEKKIIKLKWDTDKDILDAFNDYDFVEFNKLPLMSGKHRDELEQNSPRAKPKVIEPIEIKPEADAAPTETIKIKPEAKGITSRVADQTRKINNLFNTSKEVASERVAYNTRKIKDFFRVKTPEEKAAEAEAEAKAAKDREKTKNIITTLLDLITTATEYVNAEARAIAKIKAAEATEEVFIPNVIPNNELESILRIKNILELQDYNVLFGKLYYQFRQKYSKSPNEFEKIIEDVDISDLNDIGKLYNNSKYNNPKFEESIKSSKFSDDDDDVVKKKDTLINIFYLLNTFYDYKFTELENTLIKPNTFQRIQKEFDERAERAQAEVSKYVS